MTRRQSILPTVALVLGLVLLWGGERIASPDGSARMVLDAIAAVLCAIALGMRILSARSASGERRTVETRLLGCYAGVVASLALYAARTEKGLEMLGIEAGEGARIPAVLTVAFTVVLICSLLPLLFMELSYASMPSELSVERRRIDVSAQAGLSIALALSALFSLGYALDGWGKKWDLSYFKTTRPSASTRKLVDRLGAPMTIYAWFPKVNDVADQVLPYLREVRGSSKKLELEVMDQALRPKLAREQRVSKNGTIVLEQNDKRETIAVGLELQDARSKLRRLDADFQKAFLKVTRPGRTVYLTTGHEERGDPEAKDGEELKIEDFRTLLAELGVTTRNLGVGQGLASDVPDDATAVVVMGPRKPLLPEEARALARYVERGGHVLVLTDPSDESGLGPFLEAMGLKALEGTLSSASTFIPRERTASDHSMVYTNRFSAHPTVTSASRLSQRAASIFIGGGALDRAGEASGGPNVTFTIRTMPGSWLDLDGDFELDEGPEKKASLNLAAAVSFGSGGARAKKAATSSQAENEGRAVVIADGDFATDQVLRNLGNVTVLADSLRWLVGEPELPGPPESEEDVRIEHTREEDVALFYGTIFFVPAVVLGAGLGYVRITRRRRKGGAQ